VKQVSNEVQSGIFDKCYTNEEAAHEAMIKDFENTKADWAKNGEVSSSLNTDSCFIMMTNSSYDWYELYIDKLEVVNG
jgi:hypothetical protein